MGVKKYYNLGKNILYPLNRSLTGKDTIQTLKAIKKEFPNLKIKKGGAYTQQILRFGY